MFATKYLINLIILLIIALVIAVFVSKHYYSQYKSEKQERTNIQALYGKTVSEIETYKNKYNQEISKNEAIVLENRTIREMVAEGNLQWISQFEGLNKRMSNLERAYKISLKVMDSLNLKLSDTIRYYVATNGDTIKFVAKDWDYKDDWGDFKFKQLSPDSGELDYSINAPLQGVTYWDRKWFLGKKRYKTEVFSENPYIKISELIDIKVVKNNRK